jgi:hypothetical protein
LLGRECRSGEQRPAILNVGTRGTRGVKIGSVPRYDCRLVGMRDRDR